MRLDEGADAACPFCGEHDDLTVGEDGKWAWVCCLKCYAQGPRAKRAPGEGDKRLIPRVIEAWTRRLT